MANTISSASKVPIKDIVYIIAAVLWLSSIQNSVNALKLKIDGKLNMYEYRLQVVEGKDHKETKIQANISPAILPKGFNDDDDE